MTRNNDYAEKETDKILDALEDRIVEEYSLALDGIKKKYNEYTEKFKVEDEKQKKKVDEGKISEEDYKKWRVAKLYNTERYRLMADVLAEDLTKVDEKVASITNGYMPEAYALNFNYETYEIEQGTQLNTNFTLYSRETVEKLLRDDPNLLPKSKVDIPLDLRWNKKHINSAVLQGILQGKSIDSISDNLQQVTDMDRRAAIRNARTIMTGAQNSGRLDAYARADGLGIKIEKEWMATLDSRTRDSHQILDGERVPYKKAFSNGLQFPGDPSGAPEEVYNCRCTMVASYPEYEDIAEKRITYKEWVGQKEEPKEEKPFDVLSGWATNDWIKACINNPPVEDMLEKEKQQFGIFTKEEKESLKIYTGSAYEDMNDFLRLVGSGMSEIDAMDKAYISEKMYKRIKDCHNALDKAKLDKPLVLRRGTDVGDIAGLFMNGDFWENRRTLEGKTAEELNKMFQGQVGTYFGFTSTSSQWDLGFSGDVEVLFYAPEGTRASSIMKISRYGTNEGETLLRDNTRVICRKIENSEDRHFGSRIRLFLEIIPD